MVEDGDENAERMSALYSAMTPSQQRHSTFDSLIAKSKVDDLRGFIRDLSAVSLELNLGLGNVLAANHHPNVVGASIRRAMDPEGHHDRKMQFQHHGFLPRPKGSITSISILNQPQVTPSSEGSDDGHLPRFEDETLAMRGIARRSLPAKGATT